MKQRRFIALLAMVLVLVMCVTALVACNKCDGNHIDADADGKCDNCGADVTVDPAPHVHSYSSDCDSACNTCKETRTVSVACVDADVNYLCDKCGTFVLTNDPNATYTFNDYLEAGPTNWNPHAWETNADNQIAGYGAEMGLVDVSIAEDGINYTWVYEMATSIVDVTAEYAQDAALVEKWGLTVGEGETAEIITENKVYRISLNELATWEDGTPINADTYIYSMQQLLNPKMQNYRANTYYSGSAALKNAGTYFASESPIYDLFGNAPEDFNGAVYIHLDKADYSYFGGREYNLNGVFADYGYGDEAALAYLAPLANAYGYIEINEETMPVIKTAIAAFLEAFGGPAALDGWYGEDNLPADEVVYLVFGYYNTGKFTDPYDFANVGIVKVDDYTFDYILEGTETMFYFLSGMTSNWIVYEELYEAGKTQVGDLVSTDYGTSVDTYMSYGPYRLASYEKDKQIKMVRNEEWYGYTDGKHVGQFMPDRINLEIISDAATLENMFLSGKIDSLNLNATQLAEYRNSKYLYKVDQTYTFRYIFATDLAKLTALEEKRANGKNLKILSYDDFRKALSLAINRAELCAQGTGGYKPAYALFSNLYYYDVENDPNSQYRNTDIAKQVVLDLYGIKYGPGEAYATIDEAYEAVTGFDLAQAKELFQAVCEQAIADGNYTLGQAIEIQCMASAADALTEDDKAQERLLNEFVAAATKGTDLEGKITFIFKSGAADRYGDVANGAQEMIRGAWGGAAFYPFSTIRCYTEPDYMGGLTKIHESCGWNPAIETLTLTYDFDGDGSEEELTYTLQNWAKLINGTNVGEQVAFTDADTMMFIFAKLEGAVIGSYQCIPFATETACFLLSQKVSYYTQNYNIMYGYGGLRLLQFNYSDAQWAAWVAYNGNSLNY